jgi:hypothetical protein
VSASNGTKHPLQESEDNDDDHKNNNKTKFAKSDKMPQKMARKQLRSLVLGIAHTARPTPIHITNRELLEVEKIAREKEQSDKKHHIQNRLSARSPCYIALKAGKQSNIELVKKAIKRKQGNKKEKSELVKPSWPIPPFITELTTITSDIVSTAQSFPEVAGNFFEFMRRHANEYSAGHKNVKVQHIIFVAHNGKVFDIPFLIQQLSVNGMVDTFLQDKRIGFGIDAMTLAQKSIQANQTAGIPVAYNLGALYQYVTGQPPTVSHHAGK